MKLGADRRATRPGRLIVIKPVAAPLPIKMSCPLDLDIAVPPRVTSEISIVRLLRSAVSISS